jgi:hypoxanthine-guanine phosphoribosyltransferase
VQSEVTARAALDIICALAANACDADVSCVVQCTDKTGGLVLGAKGTNATKLNGKVRFEQLDEDSRPITVFKKIKSETWFSSHALKALVPDPRNLIVIAIPSSGETTSYLVILNYRRCESSLDVDNLSKLARLASAIMQSTHWPEAEAVNYTGFAEVASRTISSTGTDAILAFLARTLVKQPKLVARNGMAYTVIRRWKTQLKDTQIAALQALKVSNDPIASRLAADEIVETVTKMFSKVKFDYVVPIPSGSSGNPNGLSVQIARSISELLNIPFLNCLRNETEVGSSHPKKSIKLKPYSVEGNVTGMLLLVDDVATTGTHLKLAHAALTEKNVAVVTVAWIGT